MSTKEQVERDIRIAFLGTDAHDIGHMETALCNIFENMGLGVNRFNWGHANPLAPEMEYGRGYVHRDDNDWQVLSLRVPDSAAVTISLFIEALLEQLTRREEQIHHLPHPEREKVRRSTFSIALYEVLDDKVGRIKALQKINFSTTGVGSVYMPSVDEEQSVKLDQGGIDGKRFGKKHALPARQPAGAGIQTPFGRPAHEHLEIVGQPLLVTEEIRRELQSRVDKAAKRHKEA